MVDVRQLRYFVAIADQQSMSMASEKLGVAQPSLSHHVMRVEEELGVRLLLRSTRGVTLTDSGRRLYGHAREILRAVEAAIADVREQGADELSGPVSFAFPSSVSNVLTVPLAETVRNEFPKLTLRAMDAMSGHVQAWLLEGAVDFGFLYDGAVARELELRPLLVEPLYLVAARDCWRGEIGANGVARDSVSLREASEMGLILPHRPHGLRETVERFAQGQGFGVDVVLEMDSLSRIKTMVARGSGYSILAHAAVHEEMERGELVLAPIREPEMRRTVYLATNPLRPPRRAAQEVARLAEEIARELVRKGYWRGDLVGSPQPQGRQTRVPLAAKARKAAE